jgi:hypothetical protein
MLVPLCIGLSIPAGAAGEEAVALPVPPPEQAAQYHAETSKSIIELQQFRRSETVAVQGPGGRTDTVTLTNLNPAINAWFLLTLTGARRSYLLENPDPKGRRVGLALAEGQGLSITDSGGTHICELWSDGGAALAAANASSIAYEPLCDGRLYLRNRVAGHRTNLERMADVLRDGLWCGEAIVGFVRDTVFHDAFREEATPTPCSGPAYVEGPRAPAPAALDPAKADSAVKPKDLGIKLDRVSSGEMALGRWYPASELSGVHVSVIQPNAISPAILESSRHFVDRLDAVEAVALDYLIAFDLAEFELGFALGTDHPRLDWSPRPPAQVRGGALPGPDGVATAAPLVTTGMVNPALASRVIATFTGGFKRQHGAFRYGALALKNRGSHYGFIEQGVIFSKLQPGLATLFVLDDGAVNMTTWAQADDRMLGRIRFARQNGVALIEPDPAAGFSTPGQLVNKWGAGNWSGSADGSLRTLRAGACLQEADGKRFLIYAYFSTATPSAMARVFQAYGCRYAMLLDMNALEHTYLAVYIHRGDRVAIGHLVSGMGQVDKTVDGQLIPRFIGFPDNRDFFYLLRRASPR